MPLLKGSRIMTLDMSENRELYLHPGLTQYLPQLKVINMGENAMRYTNEPSDEKCTIIELFLHQNLDILGITNLGEVGAELDYLSQKFKMDHFMCNHLSEMLLKNNYVCKTVNSTCGAYFPEGIDCSQFPEFSLTDIVKSSPVKEDPYRYCDQYAVMPLPRSLKVLRAGNSF